jgi:hypothetical protein
MGFPNPFLSLGVLHLDRISDQDACDEADSRIALYGSVGGAAGAGRRSVRAFGGPRRLRR